MSWPTGPICRPASSSANMSIWPMPSTATRRRGWSMACSTASPASFARPSWRCHGSAPWINQNGTEHSDRVNSSSSPATSGPLAAGAGRGARLTDDAALIDIPPGRRLVVTADALVAGVHFLPEDPPDLIARKMLRVNLSDLAAMGAAPLAYLMTCCFPSHHRRSLARRLCRRAGAAISRNSPSPCWAATPRRRPAR